MLVLRQVQKILFGKKIFIKQNLSHQISLQGKIFP
jgi:hypothetical protein